MKNHFGCSLILPVMVISTGTFLSIQALNVAVQNGLCLANTGFIEVRQFDHSSRYNNFNWVDSVSASVIGTGTTLSNLGAGT